jgi:hypothetical protein
MKLYPLFLCCFRASAFIYSFFVVFFPLCLSNSVVAMTYSNNAFFYLACTDDADVHVTADSSYGDPHHSRDDDINSWNTLIDKNWNIRGGLLHFASFNTLSDLNVAKKK